MPVIRICTLPRHRLPSRSVLARAKAATLVHVTVCGMVEVMARKLSDPAGASHEREWGSRVLLLHGDLAGMSDNPEPSASGRGCSACVLAAAVEALCDRDLWRRAAHFLANTRSAGRSGAIDRALCNLTPLFIPPEAVRVALPAGDEELLSCARDTMAMAARIRGLLGGNGVLREPAIAKSANRRAVPTDAGEVEDDGRSLTRLERLERLMHMVKESRGSHLHLLPPEEPE